MNDSPQRKTKREVAQHPYVRILLAAAAGRGVVLTADEVRSMTFDDAIVTHGQYVAAESGYWVVNGKLVDDPDWPA